MLKYEIVILVLKCYNYYMIEGERGNMMMSDALFDIYLENENIIQKGKSKIKPKSKKIQMIKDFLELRKDEIIINFINEYITNNKEIRSGDPIINGTRITVMDVVPYLINETPFKEIRKEFPSITDDKEILACLLHFIVNVPRWQVILCILKSNENTAR